MQLGIAVASFVFTYNIHTYILSYFYINHVGLFIIHIFIDIYLLYTHLHIHVYILTFYIFLIYIYELYIYIHIHIDYLLYFYILYLWYIFIKYIYLIDIYTYLHTDYFRPPCSSVTEPVRPDPTAMPDWNVADETVREVDRSCEKSCVRYGEKVLKVLVGMALALLILLGAVTHAASILLVTSQVQRLPQ